MKYVVAFSIAACVMVIGVNLTLLAAEFGLI
jgi:hypothetical protein